MALSNREKWLAWGVGGIALLLIADAFVLTPFLDQRGVLQDLRDKSQPEIEAAFQARREEAGLKANWEKRRSQGLAEDHKSAERQLLGALQSWASESGLTLLSLKSEDIDSKKDLREIQMQVSASGSNPAMVKFLFKLQTARFPVRVTELQATSRSDSQDLAMQVRISTLFLMEENKDKDATAAKKEAPRATPAAPPEKAVLKAPAADAPAPTTTPATTAAVDTSAPVPSVPATVSATTPSAPIETMTRATETAPAAPEEKE